MKATDYSTVLVRGTAASLLTRVFGLGLTYLCAVVLSRTLGPAGYGAYSIALAWALILVLPSRAGLDLTALRYAAVYIEQRRMGQLRGLVRFTGSAIIVLSLVTSIAVYGLTMAGVTNVPRALAPGIALVILPLAMLGLVAVLLRNAGQIVASQFYEQVLRPGLLVTALAAATAAGVLLSPANALILTAGSALLAMLLGVIHAVRALRVGRGAADYASWHDWVGLSFPLLLTTVVQEVLNQLDIIVLGYLDTPQAAGLYSAAWRLASLVTFGLVALAAVNGPLIAAAHARGDSDELARIARITARLGFAASLLLSAVLVVGGRIILQMFGPEFAQAYPALLILLAGGLMNAFTGAVAYLLTMTGRQLQALGILVISLAVSFSLNFLLIPRLSIIGAAIASSGATITWNVAMLIMVRRRMGIDASALAAPLRLAD